MTSHFKHDLVGLTIHLTRQERTFVRLRVTSSFVAHERHGDILVHLDVLRSFILLAAAFTELWFVVRP
jgi:hypothetical protein